MNSILRICSRIRPLRRQYRAVCLTVFMLAGLAGCGREPLVDHIVYSVYASPAHPVNRHGLAPWLAAIQQNTQPVVKTKLYTAASIVGKGTVSAIRTGLIDGGLIANIYMPDELPVSMVMTNLAFFNRNSMATAGAINEFMLLNCPECDAEFAAQGIVFIGTYTATNYDLMCKQDLESTADLAGLKVRSAGPVFGRWVQRIGGVPVNMSNAHAYEALERGMLDCVLGSTAWLRSMSLWDMTRTIVDAPMGTFFGGSLFNMSMKKWYGFNARQKATILRLTPKAIADTVIAYQTESAEAEAVAASKGIRKIMPDDEMNNLLEMYKQELLQHSISSAQRRGVTDAGAIAERFLTTLYKWENLIGDKSWDNESYAELIWQHIYSSKVTEILAETDDGIF